jgi:microcystin-dependent protein
MPGVKISDLTQAPSLLPADEFAIARGGTTLKVSASLVINSTNENTSRINELSANTIFVQNSNTIDLFYDNQTRMLSADLGSYLDLRSRTVLLPNTVEIPPGLVAPFAAISAPMGWLACDGTIVPNGPGTVQGKTFDFSRLHSVVGTTYGTTPGTLPDLRGNFVRGYGVNGSDPAIRSSFFGKQQRDSFQGHKHAIHDPSHDHPYSDPSHTHGVFDPGHDHTYRGGKEAKADSKHGDDQKADDNNKGNQYQTSKERTNIRILNSTVNIDILNQVTGVRVQNPISDAQNALDPSGSTGPSGGIAPRVDHETRPNNIAMLYCIKY